MADENLQLPPQVITSQHFDFASGGVIGVKGSYGDLYIEGWDQQQVELTVTKFLGYNSGIPSAERSSRHLGAISVVAERRSPTELQISTSHKFPSNSGVRLEYQIRVPRSTRLMINHGTGNVSVSDVSGNIQAACRRGDIMLWLPEHGEYSINARVTVGKVSSDFTGASSNRFLLGQKFANVDRRASQQLHLRVGAGGITIKPIFPESLARNP